MTGGTGSAFLAVGVLAVIVVLLGLTLHVRRRRRVARAIGDRDLAALIADEDLHRIPWLRVVAVATGAAALALALADPRWGADEDVRVRGGTVVLVLDASSSMLASDLPPSRLDREREAARVVVRGLPDSPIGLIAFAGRAYAVAPPTLDPGSIELYLEALHPDMVTQTGSSLSAAVRQGLGMLVAADDSRAGAIVMISDGDTQEDPGPLREAADLARRAGVAIHVLGAGTAAGATIPALSQAPGTPADVLRNPDGDPIVTRLREAPLREIADRTGGTYHQLADPDAASRVAAQIRAAPTAAARAADDPRAAATPRYAWFAAVALALLVAEAVPRTSRRKP